MKRRFAIGQLWIASLLVLSCLWQPACRKAHPNGPDSPRAVILPASGTDVAAAENIFTYGVYQAVNAQDTTVKNKMISPLSIYMALAMADNGAGGTTQDSINGALRLGDLTVDDLNQTIKALMTQLPGSDQQVIVNLANSMWYNQALVPLTTFQENIEGNYLAKVQALNFSDPSAVTDINQWVSAQTHQMIPSIISEIHPDEIMFLINVLYFKGAWTTGFDPSRTKSAPFTMADGTQESVPTMVNSQTALYPLLQNDSVTLLELPYGGEQFVMDVLEPGPSTNLGSLQALLSPSLLDRWFAQMMAANLTLYFPKFSFAYGLDNMYPELAQMGMGIAFSDTANFSNMYTRQTFLSRVIHKTAIQVDETGTQAAAATAVGVATAIALPNQITLHIDHAFAFIIREKTSGTVLFIGMLNDPLSKGA